MFVFCTEHMWNSSAPQIQLLGIMCFTSWTPGTVNYRATLTRFHRAAPELKSSQSHLFWRLPPQTHTRDWSLHHSLQLVIRQREAARNKYHKVNSVFQTAEKWSERVIALDVRLRLFNRWKLFHWEDEKYKESDISIKTHKDTEASYKPSIWLNL